MVDLSDRRHSVSTTGANVKGNGDGPIAGSRGQDRCGRADRWEEHPLPGDGAVHLHRPAGIAAAKLPGRREETGAGCLVLWDRHDEIESCPAIVRPGLPGGADDAPSAL